MSGAFSEGVLKSLFTEQIDEYIEQDRIYGWQMKVLLDLTKPNCTKRDKEICELIEKKKVNLKRF